MALTIKTWSGFSKRVNSTKQPLDSAAVSHTVLLKDGADLLTPVFELNTLDLSINYVQAFGLYYFAYVENIDGHRCNIICKLDYLATFKAQVGAYNAYVEYAASAPAQFIYIDDPRNGPTSAVENKTSSADPGWTTSNSGCYLLGMANAVSIGNCGAPSYYVMNASDLSNVTAAIFDPQFNTNIRNQFNGVFDAIISCIWLPFDKSFVSGNGSVSVAVYAGNQDLGVGNMDFLTNRVWKKRVYVSLPSIGGYNGTYIQSGKYVTASIYLPGVGVCPLTYDIYKDSSTGVTVDIYLDFITGDILYYLSTASPNGLGESQCFSGNVAAKVPVVGSSYDGIGVAQGIISTAASVATLNPIGAVNGALGIARSLSVDNIVTGSNSSPLSLIHDKNIRIETHFQVPIHGATSAAELEAYRADNGMPYFSRATISSLSGYIKCLNASVSIPGDGEEQNVLNGYLNGGFYYE